MAVLIETSVGDIVIDLKVDEAPQMCMNFLKLCKVKYFNNCLIFSVQKDYILQTGDPSNTGKGGTSIFGKLRGQQRCFIKDEILPSLKHTVKGTVAMANTKPNENGSQFYITLRDRIEHLDGKHTIFGVVSEGLDVLDRINAVMTDENDAPYDNIRIWHTEILDDPVPDPEGLIVPPKSPEVIRDRAFKKIEDAEDELELQEHMASTLAKSQATTLELLHDLPDADIAPPDSDIFVANLNPATQDGDLELIFSRFGPIKSCEIVRDWKTGDSLQYGFITFENQKDCEEAYFKMHDCVIDDRRIVVNFSQSVAKLWNKWRTGSRVSKEDIRNADSTKGKGHGKGRGRGRGGSRVPEDETIPRLLAANEGPRPSLRGATSRSRDDDKRLAFEKETHKREKDRRRSPSRRRRSQDRSRSRHTRGNRLRGS
eukprot:TRINITY_DN63697_c0_g1_i1.p1 TRINITY_DN63697_c0_g1~~TRINITY_DN63697_c0_g1_i1.p1  ORF type:complete len:443 (+),score=75.78 TRINITY_DN63697_c0_g1_i1:50-1330(+)